MKPRPCGNALGAASDALGGPHDSTWQPPITLFGDTGDAQAAASAEAIVGDQVAGIDYFPATDTIQFDHTSFATTVPRGADSRS
jgi:hypothetical protein